MFQQLIKVYSKDLTGLFPITVPGVACKVIPLLFFDLLKVRDPADGEEIDLSFPNVGGEVPDGRLITTVTGALQITN